MSYSICNNKNNSYFSPKVKKLNELKFKELNFSIINKSNNNKKKLIGEKLYRFINIKNQLMINRKQIYKNLKVKLKERKNNNSFSD